MYIPQDFGISGLKVKKDLPPIVSPVSNKNKSIVFANENHKMIDPSFQQNLYGDFGLGQHLSSESIEFSKDKFKKGINKSPFEEHKNLSVLKPKDTEGSIEDYEYSQFERNILKMNELKVNKEPVQPQGRLSAFFEKPNESGESELHYSF